IRAGNPHFVQFGRRWSLRPRGLCPFGSRSWQQDSASGFTGRETMIPAAFDYHRPASLDDALKLLAQHGDEARVVAGGHSLIPMMKLRLAAPSHLVDLQDIAALKGIK